MTSLLIMLHPMDCIPSIAWGYGGPILIYPGFELSGVYWCFTSHASIFQSYMWRHRCEGGLMKKLYLRSGSQCHRHFAGFFNVPVLHRHGTNLFIRRFRHTAPLVAFYDTLGIRRTYSRLKPPASSRGTPGLKRHWEKTYVCLCFWIS